MAARWPVRNTDPGKRSTEHPPWLTFGPARSGRLDPQVCPILPGPHRSRRDTAGLKSCSDTQKQSLCKDKPPTRPPAPHRTASGRELHPQLRSQAQSWLPTARTDEQPCNPGEPALLPDHLRKQQTTTLTAITDSCGFQGAPKALSAAHGPDGAAGPAAQRCELGPTPPAVSV